MAVYPLIAIILVISAASSLFNLRVLKLPETIGLMVTGLLVSVLVLLVGVVLPDVVEPLCQQVGDIDFSYIVLDVLLGFLIFAGAFSADSEAMARERVPILLFATVGIVISTAIIGGLTWLVLRAIGMETPLLHCMLFGALISPTDPIAVLAILKSTAVPRSLQADIAGESLLNDGVAVVVFLTLYQMADGGHGHDPGAAGIVMLFGREVIGGALLGAAAGLLAKQAIRLAKIDTVDILLSVSVVMGTYALADKLHVSGPLALVVTGLMLGDAIRSRKTGEIEREHIGIFWDSIDYILNAVLFTLMGFLLLALAQNEFKPLILLAALIAIPVVLISRLLSLAITLPCTKLRCGDNIRSTISLLTWGGLRGGISIALALSLKPEMSKEPIVYMTYIVVVFSILVQGLTIGGLVRKVAIS